MVEEKKNKKEKAEAKTLVGTRGRIFEGVVSKKFPTRVVVASEKIVKAPKYERFFKKKTKLHAKIFPQMEINVGDYVKIRECRPLSKIVHFVVVEIVRKAGEKLK